MIFSEKKNLKMLQFKQKFKKFCRIEQQSIPRKHQQALICYSTFPSVFCLTTCFFFLFLFLIFKCFSPLAQSVVTISNSRQIDMVIDPPTSYKRIQCIMGRNPDVGSLLMICCAYFLYIYIFLLFFIISFLSFPFANFRVLTFYGMAEL